MADGSRIKNAHFVSTDWLAAHLGDPDLQVIDGSWYLPAQGRDAKADYVEGHIPGAIVFDIDALADHATSLPHMLLDAEGFAREAGALGIASDKTLVVYDGMGLFSAPRVWWTLKQFGAKQVFVLAGGLPKWKAEGRPLESGASKAAPATFAVQRGAGVADLDAVRHASRSGAAQIVDARPAARFSGDAPEPRPGLRSGHIPGSKSVPVTDIVADGQMKTPEDLRHVFEAAGVDLDRPLIATCGSGVTAATLVLALETLGKHDAALYDGSWAEYGARPELPVSTGDRSQGQSD